MKPPTHAERRLTANYLRAEATMLRSQAEEWRAKPDDAGVLLRLAAQQERRAGVFEKVAKWMVSV